MNMLFDHDVWVSRGNESVTDGCHVQWQPRLRGGAPWQTPYEREEAFINLLEILAIPNNAGFAEYQCAARLYIVERRDPATSCEDAAAAAYDAYTLAVPDAAGAALDDPVAHDGGGGDGDESDDSIPPPSPLNPPAFDDADVARIRGVHARNATRRGGASAAALKTTCDVCWAEHDDWNCATCEQLHPVCETCFKAYIESVSSPSGSGAARTQFMRSPGQLPCHRPDCRGTFSLKDVALFSSSDEFNVLMGRVQEAASRAAQIKDRRRESEKAARLARLSPLDRAVETQLALITDLMTSLCPHCGAAFLDFNEGEGACMALQCHDAACGATFCGYGCGYVSASSAPAHSNKEAHAHVLEEHRGDVGKKCTPLFPPPGTFDRVQKRLKLGRLTDQLQSLDAPVREAVMSKLAGIVDDDILDQFAGAHRVPQPVCVFVSSAPTPFTLTRGTKGSVHTDTCVCTVPERVDLGPPVCDVETGYDEQACVLVAPGDKARYTSYVYAVTHTAAIVDLPKELKSGAGCMPDCNSFVSITLPHARRGRVEAGEVLLRSDLVRAAASRRRGGRSRSPRRRNPSGRI